MSTETCLCSMPNLKLKIPGRALTPILILDKQTLIKRTRASTCLQTDNIYGKADLLNGCMEPSN